MRHVRSFGPIQQAEVALSGGEGKTVIEVDAPRDRELQAGEIVACSPAATGSSPRRIRFIPSFRVRFALEMTAEFGPRSPFSHGWYAITADQFGGMMRAIFAIIGLLALGGCLGDTQVPDEPTMYLSMANGGASSIHRRRRR